jgi:hypothetical protein
LGTKARRRNSFDDRNWERFGALRRRLRDPPLRPFARVDMATRPSGVRGERIPIFNEVIRRLNARPRRKWMEDLQLRNEQLGEE